MSLSSDKSSETCRYAGLTRIAAWFLVAVLLLMVGAVACEPGNPTKRRDRQAQHANGDIVIGAVAPWSAMENRLQQGIDLAVRDINRGGGVNGRKLRMIYKDSRGGCRTGLIASQELCGNQDVVAVVHHANTECALQAAVLFDYYGIVVFDTVPVDFVSNSYNFKRLFWIAPVYGHTSQRIADYCVRKGFRNVVVYQDGKTYGRALARAFEANAEKVGVLVPDKQTFDWIRSRTRPLSNIERWESKISFQAILLAAQLPVSIWMIEEIRAHGIDAPIMAGLALDRPKTTKMLGKNINDVIVASVSELNSSRSEVDFFMGAFQKTYGAGPDIDAARGFDVITLIAYAIQKVGTAVPAEIAESLRGMHDWPGVSGVFNVGEDGGVRYQDVELRAVRDGQFVDLPPEASSSPAKPAGANQPSAFRSRPVP